MVVVVVVDGWIMEIVMVLVLVWLGNLSTQYKPAAL